MTKTWQYPDTFPILTAAQVHVWCLPIATLAAMSLPLASMLNHAEQQHNEQHQQQSTKQSYQITRGLLRCLLGAYLQQMPSDLVFSQNVHGKPMLDPNVHIKTVSFNLSHTHKYSVIAVAHDPIGIDIENKQRELNNPLRLAKRFFHRNEYQALSQLPIAQLSQAFIHTWTAKEAYVKACGTGLAHSLKSFCVGVDPQKTPSVVNAVNQHDWRFWMLPPLDEHVGMLVSRATVTDVNYFDITVQCQRWFS